MAPGKAATACAFAVAACLALTACEVNPATGRSAFTGLMSPAEEAQSLDLTA